jgi:steroid delta-isomerase-like uncharacterized protein
VAAAAPNAAGAFELREFVARYMSAWNGCDAEALARLVCEDVVWEDPALAQPARGVGEVAHFMRFSCAAFPDLSFSEPEPPALAASGDIVLWGWRMQGTNRGEIDPPGFAPTGRRMDIEGIDRWVMRDGRIARYRAFYDSNELARQLGIVPARGSGGERAMVVLQRLQARVRGARG